MLKLKQEYVTATPERQAQLALEAQRIRESAPERTRWSVRADKSLDYYMIDTDITEDFNNLMQKVEKENFWKRFLASKDIALSDISFDSTTGVLLYLNAIRYVDFAWMVRTGGIYDLKSKTEWQGKQHFIYEGNIIWYDDPGNILYGYLGKVMGFDDHTLMFAGGVQIATRTSSWSYVSSFFDDPRDQVSIKTGIDKFKNSHSFIWW